MKVFSQFLTSGEHDRLAANLEREKELRHRLSELTRYRSLGLTTQDDVTHYEQHMAHQKLQQMKHKKSVSFDFKFFSVILTSFMILHGELKFLI